MAIYGYARASSADQDYSFQEQVLRTAGCEVIRAEKRDNAEPGRFQTRAITDKYLVFNCKLNWMCGIILLFPNLSCPNKWLNFLKYIRKARSCV